MTKEKHVHINIHIYKCTNWKYAASSVALVEKTFESPKPKRHLHSNSVHSFLFRKIGGCSSPKPLRAWGVASFCSVVGGRVNKKRTRTKAWGIPPTHHSAIMRDGIIKNVVCICQCLCVTSQVNMSERQSTNNTKSKANQTTEKTFATFKIKLANVSWSSLLFQNDTKNQNTKCAQRTHTHERDAQG